MSASLGGLVVQRLLRFSIAGPDKASRSIQGVSGREVQSGVSQRAVCNLRELVAFLCHICRSPLWLGLAYERNVRAVRTGRHAYPATCFPGHTTRAVVANTPNERHPHRAIAVGEADVLLADAQITRG